MIPVITPAQARAADAASGLPLAELVERAGAAVARAALEMLGGTYGRRVVVLVGPGTNGADGRAAARVLAARGVWVRVVDLPGGGDRIGIPDMVGSSSGPVHLVIDAVFGTGTRDTWQVPDVGDVPVLAVDLPSGLDPLTGEAASVIPAARTVALQALKPGLLLGDGPDVAGVVTVADIGLDIGSPHAELVERDDVASWITPRPRTADKWSAALRVVAGSPGMLGAASLAAGSALRSGSGMVRLSSVGAVAHEPQEAVHQPLGTESWSEVVLEDLHRFAALVIGPGLGRTGTTPAEVASTVFRCGLPVVVDGDGLFALTWNPHGAPTSLRQREPATVLTPHDGEYRTLTGEAPPADRIAAANRLVADTGAVVVLKGPTTIVASPDGRTRLVDTGDQRLATAGTGDVLAGIIGAFLARGIPAARAAAAAAWVHGTAAQSLPAAGVTAGDVLAAVGTVIADLETGR
ncbi:MAG: hypothetical protein RIR49_1900 [Actinomycetota bacterium]|jgi:hydroxyethylthiazole kinase-like uncharacterized protein yjeF